MDLARLISKKLNIKENFIFKELPNDPLQRKQLKSSRETQLGSKIDLNSGTDKTIDISKNLNKLKLKGLLKERNSRFMDLFSKIKTNYIFTLTTKTYQITFHFYLETELSNI